MAEIQIRGGATTNCYLQKKSAPKSIIGQARYRGGTRRHSATGARGRSQSRSRPLVRALTRGLASLKRGSKSFRSFSTDETRELSDIKPDTCSSQDVLTDLFLPTETCIDVGQCYFLPELTGIGRPGMATIRILRVPVVWRHRVCPRVAATLTKG